MLKVSKIDNLFGKPYTMTSASIPIAILHPQIESEIITKYGDIMSVAWVLHITIDGTTIPYTVVTSNKSGSMYRIEYINTQTTVAFDQGYEAGHAQFINANPYKIKTQPKEWKQWVDGYHNGYKHSKETTPI